ncbi:uncharacterized protein [Antedon mediterranea]|uniref:uncharacterized protein n=1 Tax=Antedon mediterranea TaxID=105859 RepID=UPI003AF9698B
MSSHISFKPSVSQLPSPPLPSTPMSQSQYFIKPSPSQLPSTTMSSQSSTPSSSPLPSPSLPSPSPMSSQYFIKPSPSQLPSTTMSSQSSGQSSSPLPPTTMSSQLSEPSSSPLPSPSPMSPQFSGQSSSPLPSHSLPSTPMSSQFSRQLSSPLPSPSLPSTTISVVPFKSRTTLLPFISLASTSSPSTILVQSSSPLASSTLNSLPTTTVVTTVDTPVTNGSVTAEDDREQTVTKARPSQQFTFTAEQLTTKRRSVQKTSTRQQQTTGWPSDQTSSFDKVSPEVITSSILTVSGQMIENEDGALNKSNYHDNGFPKVLIVCLCLLFMAVIAGILFIIKGRKVQQKYYFQPKHGENKDKEPPSVDICDLRPLNKDERTIQKDDGILNCAYNNDSKV